MHQTRAARRRTWVRPPSHDAMRRGDCVANGIRSVARDFRAGLQALGVPGELRCGCCGDA
jgi:hypothetical protein